MISIALKPKAKFKLKTNKQTQLKHHMLLQKGLTLALLTQLHKTQNLD